MDKSLMLPVSTIIFMWIGLVLTFVLPMAAMVFFGVKKRGSALVSLWGVLGYGVSFCVYGLIWCVYVTLFSDGYDTTGLTWDFYMIFAVLTGIIATLFNYLLLKKICKKKDRAGIAVSYYAGFGLVVCYQTIISQIRELYWAIKYNNSEGLEALTEGMSSKEADYVIEQLYSVSVNGSMYLVKGLEALLYVVCYLALGYLLYIAVKKAKKWHMAALFFVMILQFGITLPAQLIKSGTIDAAGKAILLAAVATFAVICVGVVYFKKVSKAPEGAGK